MSKLITEDDIDWGVLRMMLRQLFLVQHDTFEFRGRVLEAANGKGGGCVLVNEPNGLSMPLKVDAYWAGNQQFDFRMKVYPDVPVCGMEYGVYVNKRTHHFPIIDEKCFDRDGIRKMLSEVNLRGRYAFNECNIVKFLCAEVSYGFGYWPGISIWHNFGCLGDDILFEFQFESFSLSEYVGRSITMAPVCYRLAMHDKRRQIYWNPKAMPLEKTNN